MKFKYSTILSLATFALSTAVANATLMFGDVDNGAKLHAAKCVGCHRQLHHGKAENMYLRGNHKVKTIEGLTGQVNFCNQQIGSNLGADEIDDLIIFLNEKVYKFE